jgi:putative membrane protein
VLLVTIVAPLLVWSVPPAARPGAPSILAATTAVQTLVFWLWHAPPVYGWALSSDSAYWLMQVSLLAVAAAFWASIRRASAPAAAASLLATMVQMGLLGALITFAPRALYAPHFVATAAWGYSPLEDQQLAGLIMWAPAAALYLGAALLLLARMIGPDPERVRAG